MEKAFQEKENLILGEFHKKWKAGLMWSFQENESWSKVKFPRKGKFV